MNPNDPAFPCVQRLIQSSAMGTIEMPPIQFPGIPIRLYIAAQIMAQMIPQEAPTKYTPEEMATMISKTSLSLADALIAAHNKETK